MRGGPTGVAQQRQGAGLGQFYVARLSGSVGTVAGPEAPLSCSYGCGFPAQLGVTVQVVGWVEYYVDNDGCHPLPGHWTLATPPTHGQVSTGTVSGTIGGCGVMPFDTIFYIWTDPNPANTSDSFTDNWQSDDDRFSGGGNFSAGRKAPFKQKCDCECPCAGNPFNIAKGDKNEQVTDYETQGQNKLSFVRYYTFYGYRWTATPTTVAAALGFNWRSNFDRYLTITYSNAQPIAVSAERGDGRLLSFGWNGSQWVSDSDIDARLAQSGANWILTDSDDTVETYAPIAGKVVPTAIQARNGYTQSLQYDGSGLLVSVTDSYGRSLAFSYQGGLLTTLNTPDGTTLAYGYTASGLSGSALDRLASVTYSTNPTTTQTYVYENSNLRTALTGIVDENGDRFATWAYDGYGRVTSSQHAGGADLTTISYNDDQFYYYGAYDSTVTNALGQQEEYRFGVYQGTPKLRRVDRLQTATTATATRFVDYDANGYVASRTDWGTNDYNGIVKTYVNDARGQPTTITEAVGTPQQRTTTISYHATFHLPLQITAPGLRTNFTYDAMGNLLTRTETDTTTTTVPYSTNGQTRTWTYSWANSLLASITDPRGKTTQFAYDGSGALIQTTNPLGQMIKITQHSGGGLPLTIVDPNGVVTNLAYDARQRLVSRTVNTSTGPLTTSYSYDAAGNLIQVTQPDGSAIASTFDDAHRLVALADLFNQQTRYTLDALGDRTQTLILDGSSNTTRTRSASFDALGRMLQDIGGVGQTTTYAYDVNGNRIKITDPLGRVTTQAYDALNRRTQISDPAGGVTARTYDAQDRLAKLTDPNGHATSYVYDGFGDLIGQVSPDSGNTVFYYDPAGNLVKRVDASGVVTNYAYDALNRLTSRTYPGNPSENVALAYDEAGHGYGVGQLTTVVDNGGVAGSLARSYDERGNVVSEVRSAGAITLSTAYVYDAASRVAAITYPSGALASYSRDAMGRITALAAKPPGMSPLPVTSQISYQPFGPVAGLVYGNGITESRAFDLDYRLTGITAAGRFSPHLLSYQYDAADNVLAISDNLAGNQSFTYDALNRLSGMSGFYGNFQLGFDAVGNVLSITNGAVTETLNYAAGNNRLAAVNFGGNPIRQFGYTPTGNIVSDQQSGKRIDLAYNQANRLAAATIQPNGGQPANYQYLYDASGRRLLKSLQGTPGMTVYQHDLAGHLLEEGALSSNTLQPQIDYLYLGERPIAMLSPATGALVLLHGDRLDTPQVATAQEQKMPWAAAYSPFGTIKPIVAYLPQNLRLPGQYADQETGYYHNGFRTYDPNLGRYLQTDPIGLKGGVNTYAYALMNPLANVDTSGLRIIPPSDDPNGYYRQAIDYLLHDPDTVKTFRELASDPHGDWHIKFRDKDNYADPGRTIYWDPLAAIVDPCGHRISPALALLHEMEHALRFAYPDRHPITGPMGPDPQYDSPEERRVIQGPEADAARKLGEDVRTSHHGDYYDVPGPTRR